MLKDQFGNKFKWKVRCLSKPLEKEFITCYICNGTGYVTNIDDLYDTVVCDRCFGSCKIEKTIICTDPELEKFLESKIPEYYQKNKKYIPDFQI